MKIGKKEAMKKLDSNMMEVDSKGNKKTSKYM
jgi:hypothetical protein